MRVMQTQQLPTNDSTFVRFLTCIYEKQGYQDKNGNIQYGKIEEFLRNYYSDTNVDKIVKPCAENKENINDGYGTRAYSTAKCLLNGLRLVANEDYTH